MENSLTIKNDSDFRVFVEGPQGKCHLLVGRNEEGLHEVVSDYCGHKWYVHRVGSPLIAIAVLDYGQVKITPDWGVTIACWC